MSQIFDALQKSDDERLGFDLSALTAAAKPSQRTERQGASNLEAAVLSQQPDARESEKRDALTGRQEPAAIATSQEFLFAPGLWPSEERQEIFDQIQPLQISLPAQHRLVCLTDTESPAAEAFRLLGVRLRHLRKDRPLKKVLITSTIPQEGKSTVAANLACTLALRTEHKVLLLEGDLRRPTLSKMFGLGKNPGICEQLLGQRSLISSIYRLEGPGFWLLPVGIAPSNPLELLQSGRLTELVDRLSGWFDWIIIDSPPVLPLADTSVWMRLADGILLVTRQGTTEKRKLQRGLEAIESQKLIGALLNGTQNSSDSDYYDYSPTAISSINDNSTN